MKGKKINTCEFVVIYFTLVVFVCFCFCFGNTD